MGARTLTLIGKPGCHLCDDAKAVVDEVVAGLDGVTVEERSILDDAGLFEKYSEKIPVLMVDDRVHAVWRVDPQKLRAALAEVKA